MRATSYNNKIMKILVTGAKGFVGKNLCAQLNNIKDGKARCYGELKISDVFEYDLDSTSEQLDNWCKEADFVFNLAGVNRPKDNDEFMKGNFGFASTLLDTLKKYHNTCPVMLSSSAQASLTGRFGNSEYGRSKKAGEDLFLQYGKETGAKVLVYRFPNLYGKWCRPNYNSAVATFCNNIANDLPIQVNDPSVELELLYIDDLVDEMIHALKGEEHHCEFEGLDVHPEADGRYCYCPVTHKVTLGEIVDLLHQFAEMPKTLMIPEIPADSFAKRLYSTFLSYLPKEKAIFDLKMNVDQRGSFTELVHTLNCGQVSILLSPQIIDILAGSGYEGAILPMQIIMPVVVLTGAAQVCIMQALIPLKEDKAVLLASVIGAATAVLFNIIFVDKLGAIGSALVLLCSEICSDIFAFGYAIKKKILTLPWRFIVKRIISSIPYIAICYTAGKCLNLNNIATLLIALLICGFYFVVESLFVLKLPIVRDFFAEIKKQIR